MVVKLLFQKQQELHITDNPTQEDVQVAFQSVDTHGFQLIRLAHGQLSTNFISVGDGNILIRPSSHGKLVFSPDMIEPAYLQDSAELRKHGLDFETREFFTLGQAIEVATCYLDGVYPPPAMCFLTYRDNTDDRVILNPQREDIQRRLDLLDGREQIGFCVQRQKGSVSLGYVNKERVMLGFRTHLSPSYRVFIDTMLLDPTYFKKDSELAVFYSGPGDIIKISATVDYQRACAVATYYALRERFPKGLVWRSDKMDQFTDPD